jgi:hypothetical protein
MKMASVVSSVVEHLTTDHEVEGSNQANSHFAPGAEPT